MDPVQRSIITDLFGAIPEEMGHVLRRSAYSPNIKERMDASCAIFDEKGQMLAQAEHIPVHLGSMPIAVQAVLEGFEGELHPEDQIILNDPYRGGTHLPDITLIMPVFHNDQLVAFSANRAHHSDVGADQPGSLPPYSMYLEEEGMVIPPHFLVRDREINDDLITTIQQEMRNPDERLGDLRAQIGANRRGQQKVKALIEEHGVADFRAYSRELRNYSSDLVRSSITKIPDGTYQAEGWMESTGMEDETARIELELAVRGSDLDINFSGTDPQVRGNANSPLPVTISACYYVVRSLTDHDAPLNHGCYEMVKIQAPSETLVNPTEPHAVCSGNVETSQRIVDVLFDAFRKAAPEQVPAQSQGTMNNLVIGTEDDEGEEKTYYETIGGGEGAYPWRDGQDGIQTHMTNTKNTPVEALEHEYPLRVHQYRLRPGSGGAGTHSGGEGIIREVEYRGESGTFSIISERRTTAPSGANGGEDGQPGRNVFISDEGKTELGSRAHGQLQQGDRIRVETPGGGGHGSNESDA